MKRRKNIRDAFKSDGESVASELKTAVITQITNYPGNINDFFVYYESDGSKRISFTDGSVLYSDATSTTTASPTTTAAPITTTTTTPAP